MIESKQPQIRKNRVEQVFYKANHFAVAAQIVDQYDPGSGAGNSEQFSDRSFRVWNDCQNISSHDEFKRMIRKAKIHGVHLDEINMTVTCLTSFLSGFFEHPKAVIETKNVDALRIMFKAQPSADTDFQNPGTGSGCENLDGSPAAPFQPWLENEVIKRTKPVVSLLNVLGTDQTPLSVSTKKFVLCNLKQVI